jgi:hypothetical protein
LAQHDRHFDTHQHPDASSRLPAPRPEELYLRCGPYTHPHADSYADANLHRHAFGHRHSDCQPHAAPHVHGHADRNLARHRHAYEHWDGDRQPHADSYQHGYTDTDPDRNCHAYNHRGGDCHPNAHTNSDADGDAHRHVRRAWS